MHTQDPRMAHPNIHKQGEDIEVKVNTQSRIHTSFSKYSEVGRDFVRVLLCGCFAYHCTHFLG